MRSVSLPSHGLAINPNNGRGYEIELIPGRKSRYRVNQISITRENFKRRVSDKPLTREEAIVFCH